MKKFFSLLATLLVLALAIWIGRTLWVHYMNTPWTRDARARAETYAGALGVRVRRIVSISEGGAAMPSPERSVLRYADWASTPCTAPLT